MYKSRLQDIFLKRHWLLPEYSVTRMGPDHAPVFRATVDVAGEKFYSSDESTKMDAQNQAAKAAFEVLQAIQPTLLEPLSETKISFKSKLQHYAQKGGMQLPSYEYIKEGPDHSPLFKSEVTIDGQTFVSPQYYSKLKMAVDAAAEVAYLYFEGSPRYFEFHAENTYDSDNGVVCYKPKRR